MPLISPVELIKKFYKCKHIFLKPIDYLKKIFCFPKRSILIGSLSIIAC